MWAHGIRGRIAEGYALLGEPVPFLPVSLTPYGSLSTLLGIIPPLAVFVAIVRLRADRVSWLAAALLAGAVAGIVLGALQVVSTGPNFPWYLYRETNLGLAVGFFANANHMADLLVIALPFVAAIAAAGRSGSVQRYSALISVLAGIAMVLVVGIALNSSLAGYALSLPVVAASALIIMPPTSRWRGLFAAAVALLAVASIGGLASSSIGATKIGEQASGAFQSRGQILNKTSKAIADFMPFGSGLGSFVKVYRLYESPAAVTNEYVIHAHNDYAELALELGAPGIVLLLFFLMWWAVACLAVWRKGEGGPWAQAASVASAAVLVHSMVDFPLRTAAISACFAMCLALLADRWTAVRQDAKDLRPTRHVVIG
jgi:O-antigen ligase